MHALHAALREQDLGPVVERLREAGIEALFFKGPAVARLYPEPGLRPYGDFDVLVAPDRVERAREAVAGAISTTVDVHGRAWVLNNVAVESVDLDVLFARSEVVRLDGLELRTVGPEDHLRLLCLHFLAHGGWRPLWLCDVAAALEARPGGFDWDICLGGDRRLSRAVACTIALAGELLKADLGDAPAQRPPAWMRRAVLRQWGVPASIYPGLVAGRPLKTYLRQPGGLLAALRARWPSPLESTLFLRVPLGGLPRFPFQLAYLLYRVGYFRWLPRERRVRA